MFARHTLGRILAGTTQENGITYKSSKEEIRLNAYKTIIILLARLNFFRNSLLLMETADKDGPSDKGVNEPSDPPLSERDIQELTRAFDKWFTGLLLRDNSSCLERDVLRECRKELKAKWLEIRPTYTTSDLERAKVDGAALKKRIFGDGT